LFVCGWLGQWLLGWFGLTLVVVVIGVFSMVGFVLWIFGPKTEDSAGPKTEAKPRTGSKH